MLSLAGVALIVCFLIATAIGVAFVLGAGRERPDCTIARVLYDAEHAGKIR